MWWLALAVLILAPYLVQKPQPNQKPAELQKPTADEGANIPVLFGRRRRKTNVIYHGGVKSIAVKKKSSKK